MCKVYNSVGCLTTVKSHLHRHNITEFKSLNEVIAFQKNYDTSRQQIISNSEIEIENEKRNLISENLKLTDSIERKKIEVEKKILEEIEYLKLQLESLSLTPKNAWQKISKYFKVLLLKKKVRHKEVNLPFEISQSVHESVNTLIRNETRYDNIISRFQDEVIDNCSAELRTLERNKAVIDEVNNSIFGALGEQKVVKELEKLSDEHVLINDFCLFFTPPIYNRQENDHIKSIQVDHLLIAPSGIFLIETKNWSEQSLNSLNLRSPISQLKRTNFALFTVLTGRTGNLSLNQHHWGKKKIPLRSLLILTNQKPREEFQYVKVLTLNELLNYIKYFPPIFTRNETANIADDLVSLSRK